MQKFSVKQLMTIIDQSGRLQPKEFARIGFNPANAHAYLRDRIRNGSIVVERTAEGTFYSLSDKGRQYLHSEPKPVPVKENAPIEIHNDTMDAAINALGQAIVTRITTIVDTQIGSLVESLVNKHVTTTVNRLTAGIAALPTTPITTPKLKRVLVLGLLPEQQHMIHKEFDSVFKLTCLGSNDNANLIKSNSAHADSVFIVADFISHSTIKLVESTGCTPRIVKGGMTSLRDAMTKYYVGA